MSVIKLELGYNPLTVTVRPHLESELGKINLENFIKVNSFAHYHISNTLRYCKRI